MMTAGMQIHAKMEIVIGVGSGLAIQFHCSDFTIVYESKRAMVRNSKKTAGMKSMESNRLLGIVLCHPVKRRVNRIPKGITHIHIAALICTHSMAVCAEPLIRMQPS